MADPCTLEDIPAEHIRTIRSEQANGPYFLGGWSRHGLEAYECARQLTMQGEQVPLIVMFDSECNLQAASRSMLGQFVQKFRFNYQLLRSVPRGELVPFLKERSTGISGKLRRRFVIGSRSARSMLGPEAPIRIDDHLIVSEIAAQQYRPLSYDGNVLLIRSRIRPNRRSDDLADGWDKVITGPLRVEEVPGDHRSMFQAPNVSELGRIVSDALNRAHEVVGPH